MHITYVYMSIPIIYISYICSLYTAHGPQAPSSGVASQTPRAARTPRELPQRDASQERPPSSSSSSSHEVASAGANSTKARPPSAAAASKAEDADKAADKGMPPPNVYIYYICLIYIYIYIYKYNIYIYTHIYMLIYDTYI